MQNHPFKYPKEERLKSRITIDEMFSNGKSVGKYPLRLVFIPVENTKNLPLQMGVSVSKRYFKRAVDRNYFKRLLREAYRLNKHLLLQEIKQPYAIMFFYQTKERLTYTEIEEKTIKLFHKFNEFIKNNPQV